MLWRRQVENVKLMLSLHVVKVVKPGSVLFGVTIDQIHGLVLCESRYVPSDSEFFMQTCTATEVWVQIFAHSICYHNLASFGGAGLMQDLCWIYMGQLPQASQRKDFLNTKI